MHPLPPPTTANARDQIRATMDLVKRRLFPRTDENLKHVPMPTNEDWHAAVNALIDLAHSKDHRADTRPLVRLRTYELTGYPDQELCRVIRQEAVILLDLLARQWF